MHSIHTCENYVTYIPKIEENTVKIAYFRHKCRYSTFVVSEDGYRNTILNKDIINVVCDVLEFDRIKELYDLYMKKHTFAQDISFEDFVKSIYKLIDCVKFSDPIKLSTDITLVRHGQDEQDKVGGWMYSNLLKITPNTGAKINY